MEVTTVVEVANEVSLDKGLKVEVQTRAYRSGEQKCGGGQGDRQQRNKMLKHKSRATCEPSNNYLRGW